MEQIQKIQIVNLEHDEVEVVEEEADDDEEVVEDDEVELELEVEVEIVTLPEKKNMSDEITILIKKPQMPIIKAAQMLKIVILPIMIHMILQPL
jgi:hypothetical protein